MLCQGAIPQLLQHILIVVSFKWNVQKLIYLKSVLQNTHAYQTHVSVHIVCDESAAMDRVLKSWDFSAKVHESQADLDKTYQSQHEPYAMLWDHRKVVEEAALTGLYSTYIYIEDDTGITWPALMSWALDQQLLEPLGFSRAFYRTEVRPEDGTTMLLDVFEQINLDKYNRTLNLQRSDHMCMQARTAGGTRCKIMCPHNHYIQLAQPYMGMWLASHATLTKWMQHDFWDKDTALKADIEIGLGYPERSNGMFMLIDVPKGFQTSNLVPYDPIERVLLSEARIFHERNGYSTQPTSQFAKLEEHAVFSSSK